MPAFGVYPIADVETAGEEVSSTYEGRHVTVLESDLIHPNHADGLVDKGDPVVFGTVALQAVGVAFKSAAAATDLVAVDTEGIWIIDVNAADDGGNVAVEGGDRLYINTTTAAVSKIATAASQVPFGYALGHVDSGNTDTIAVKVHWDPVDNMVLDEEPFFFGDSRDVSITWSGTNQRLTTHIAAVAPNYGDGYGADEVDVGLTGEVANHVACSSSWINLNATVAAGGILVTPRTDGIYVDSGDAGDTSNALVAYGGRFSYVGDNNAAHLALFSLNVSGGDACEGIFSKVGGLPDVDLGYAADATTDSTKCGDIPIFVDMNTGNQLWIRVYDAAS